MYRYVEILYEKDQKNENRLAPKLTEAHINPNNFQKMKVKLATQLLSRTVAAITTANFILCMDSLFDIINSDCRTHSKIYKQAFVNADYQVNFLNIAKQYLSIFLLYNTKTGKESTNLVKSFKCWIHNINFLTQFWTHLQDHFEGVEYLLMRHLCTDAIEHFFLEN